MKKIEMDIECPTCGGTGVYVGACERKGAAVVCNKCGGTGKYNYIFHYNEFSGRKIKSGIKRVYRDSYGYCVAPERINITNVGMVDLGSEGVSYDDFLDGRMPEHSEQLACPLLADQNKCHRIKGFVRKCEQLHGESLWGIHITSCRFYERKSECWKRFREACDKK